MSSALPKELAYYLTPHDQQLLTTTVAQLAPPLQAAFLQCVRAAATSNARSLSAALPLLGPILHALPAHSRVVLLERMASLSQSFPAAVVPLFRSLGQVYDEVGEERTLAWIDAGEEIARRGPEAGAAFFALKSRTSVLTLRGVLPHVYLSDIQGVLLKYLHMLSGAAIGLVEIDQVSFPPPLVKDESDVVLLPFCIDRFPTYEENFRLYRVLVAHQVGRIEFGTYACKLVPLWPALSPFLATFFTQVVSPAEDLLSYFQLFPRPDLMEQLFLTIEGKRVAARLATLYPGLQTDLAWADSLMQFLSPEILAVLSAVSSTTWTQLSSAGTSADALLLATQLYAAWLRDEARPVTAASVSASFEDIAEEEMGFITGVNLGRSGKSSSQSEKERLAHQRRTVTTADLRYVYDEWDFEIEDYRPHWCEVREVPLLGDGGAFFAQTVATHADLVADVKREFQKLRPRLHHQVKGLEDGEEIDLNAVVAAHVDRLSGLSPSLKIYSARQLIERDVAVLFLLDLSASTATRLPTGEGTEGVSPAENKDSRRVIDLIKEAVVLLSIALDELGDAYAIYGFSSSGRHAVEVYPVKNFKEALVVEAQGRIGALTPRGSTRMGAAVRHAIRRLKGVSSRSRMLVVLSDGYPEDEDYGKPVTPPMYGLRDTLVALREAERSGISSFFLTVDKGGHDYLREMCPSSRYMVIEDVRSLPTELPKIYQRYIWSQWR